jgi:hypothetical protein
VKADDLWHKHLHNDMYATKAGFLAALQEYGELVKAEAVKVCENERVDADDTKQESDYAYNTALEHAANAIKEMKLP